MKNFYSLLFFLTTSFFAFAQTEFITTWEVNDNDLSITIPTTGTGYDYSIDFGDGNSENNITGDVTHTYNSAGIYTVTISGNFPRIYFLNNQTDADKILSINQWGSNPWQSMQSAFAGCSNLQILAVDTPDLSQATNLNFMFSSTGINQPINNWDVSNITSMRGIFFTATNFNQPLDNWDVSNVTDMSYMFTAASAFNQPLNNWNVSNVTNMESMFSSNQSFNQPLNNWDVSNVTNMDKMFTSSIYNQPLDNWDVSNVTSMQFLFSNSKFNQPLNNWDVSSVTNMDNMFSSTENFNQPLSNWDVSNVTTMFAIFSLAENFNQDLSNWNFNPAVDFRRIVSSSNLDIENYDALLAHFVELGYTNKIFRGIDLIYCNENDRNFLINNLGWDISEDTPAENCNLSTMNVNSPNFTLYPNPTSGIVFIASPNKNIIQTIEILNISGQKIQTIKKSFEKIDLSLFSSGIYFLKINGTITKKIIKK